MKPLQYVVWELAKGLHSYLVCIWCFTACFVLPFCFRFHFSATFLNSLQQRQYIFLKKEGLYILLLSVLHCRPRNKNIPKAVLLRPGQNNMETSRWLIAIDSKKNKKISNLFWISTLILDNFYDAEKTKICFVLVSWYLYQIQLRTTTKISNSFINVEVTLKERVSLKQTGSFPIHSQT